MRKGLLCFLMLSCVLCSAGQVREKLHTVTGRIFFEEREENCFHLKKRWLTSDSTHHENPRVVAIILDVTLGILGMHRLYLGTDLKVPIFYALTLGGGGVLWLIDLVMLIATKDIEVFMDNPKLFMWAE